MFGRSQSPSIRRNTPAGPWVHFTKRSVLMLTSSTTPPTTRPLGKAHARRSLGGWNSAESVPTSSCLTTRLSGCSYCRPTRKGKAKVQPGNGVKVNYNYYWTDEFRNPAIENTGFRFATDPFNAGVAWPLSANTTRSTLKPPRLATTGGGCDARHGTGKHSVDVRRRN